MSKPLKISAQHRLFAAEYVASGFNATAACAAAGYSVKSAYSAGPRLLARADVQCAIAKNLGPRMEALGLKGERVLIELMRIAYADLGDAFGPNGELLSLRKMPEATRRALAGIDKEASKDGVVLKVRTHDKLKALELLGKYHKLFTDLTETKDLTPPKDPTPPLTNDERRAELRMHLAREAAANAVSISRGERPTYSPTPIS